MKKLLLLAVVALSLFSCQEKKFQEAANRKLCLCELAFSKVKPIHDTILLKHKQFQKNVDMDDSYDHDIWRKRQFSKYCDDIFEFTIRQIKTDSLDDLFDKKFAITDKDYNIITDYNGDCKSQKKAIMAIMDDTNHYLCDFLIDSDVHPSWIEINLAPRGEKSDKSYKLRMKLEKEIANYRKNYVNNKK